MSDTLFSILPDDVVPPDNIASIKRTLNEQADALHKLAEHIDPAHYQKALALMSQCKGHVILSGMGKSGHVGRKMSATLASTGTPSFFIHPAEAFHGDLGMITPYDLLILISASGETDEILKLIPSLKAFGNRIIALTNVGNSTLAHHADAVLELMMESESCPNNLAPTTSTTLTMAIGDALAIALMQQRQFQPTDFARYHPGGSLGRRLLTRVADLMQTTVPQVQASATFREVIQEITGGCQGMVAVNDEAGRLVGIITDGDLRRALAKCSGLDTCTARDIMTSDPITLPQDTMIADAERLMQQARISALLVTGEGRDVVGLIRIFD
ncbi:KpsF/GutQ family sugar-phosphate isomerase [Chimaeribacter arupi]|uniref:Arabinose 5-phosphate isomerase n=1 Tax=Nissabacter archeti TaxID=1917880 RepID=A0ABS5JI92_9GAMM|nr:KpsF/GutQ family sugar-phosphate isomerase [Chimaeribacter arupi]MBS0969652.1 KpsF/GutQ family sugar-phosphate isomerase [Nissabacter archeti]MDV5142436.1 KpsF/GutQ family sugar-phosphate isomerase [Chimaeribacter arupi]WKZ91256.1 KpsF/GutQ family sugar-phosphate isomerase [Chimaeribacter arupi]